LIKQALVTINSSLLSSLNYDDPEYIMWRTFWLRADSINRPRDTDNMSAPAGFL